MKEGAGYDCSCGECLARRTVFTYYCELCFKPTRDGSYRCDQHRSTRPLCSVCGVYPAEIIEEGTLYCLDPSCSGRRG